MGSWDGYAMPDVSRTKDPLAGPGESFGSWAGRQKRKAGAIGLSALYNMGQALSNPEPYIGPQAIKGGLGRAVDLVNPVPGLIEAGRAEQEFMDNPSWKNAGKAAFRVGMAGLDVGFTGEALHGTKQMAESAIRHLGRY